MKTLVVYYSRTGITKKVAEEIADLLKADAEEILDTQNRKGAMGYLMSGREAMQKKFTILHNIKKDPSKYDLIIIGTPVWAFNISVPIRTYIMQNASRFKKVAFFCTQGGTGDKNAFEEMRKLTKKDPLAKLALKTSEVSGNKAHAKITGFVSSVLDNAGMYIKFKCSEL